MLLDVFDKPTANPTANAVSTKQPHNVEIKKAAIRLLRFFFSSCS